MPSTKPKAEVDPVVAATSLWLVEELRNRGVEKPYVNKTSKGWQVKDGNKLIGRPRSEWMDERSQDAIECCFRIPGSVTLELEPWSWHAKTEGEAAEGQQVAHQKWVKKHKKKKPKKGAEETATQDEAKPKEEPVDHYPELFEVIQLVTKGQRAVVRSLLKEEGREPYPVLAEAIGATVERVQLKTSKGKKAKEGATRNKLSDNPLSGSLTAFASKQASDKMRTWLKKEAEQSPPWFKAKSLPLPRECFDLVLCGRDLDVILTLRAAVNGRSPHLTGKAVARGNSQWSTLHKILKPGSEYTIGGARLVWDDDRYRFQLKVSYSYPRPSTKEGVDTLVVCPGLDSILRLWASNGRGVGRVDDSKSYFAHRLQFEGRRTPHKPTAKSLKQFKALGKDPNEVFTYDLVQDSLLQTKLAFDAKRSSMAQHLNHQGRGARGHGRNRFLRIKTEVSEKEALFTKSYCEQQGSLVARLASGMTLTHEGWVQTREPYAEVLLNDWSTHLAHHPDKRIEKILRRFPSALLREKIIWALTKAGINYRVLKVGTSLCPSCLKGKMEFDKISSNYICNNDECKQEIPKDFLTAWATFRAGTPSKVYDYDAVSESFRKVIRDSRARKNQTTNLETSESEAPSIEVQAPTRKTTKDANATRRGTSQESHP
jgi:hypothetical protein